MAKGLAKAAAADPALSAWQRAHPAAFLANHPGYKAPPPPTIQQQAQAQIDPIITALTAAANQRAAQAAAAIKGYTDSYAKGLSGIDYGAPYAGAEAQQAAVDEALRQALTGQGSSLSSGLESRLSALQGSSGANAVNQEAQALASQGRGAGNAALAAGSANLGNLLADAAAAQSYGQKMPGIVDLAGIQNESKAQQAAQAAISSGTLAAEQQLPSIVQQLKTDKLQRANLKLSAQKAAISAAQGQQRLQIEAQNSANTARHDRALEAQAQANYGLSLARLKLAAQKAQQTRKAGGMTANELATMRQKAASDLQSYYHGVAAKYQIGANGARELVAGTGPGSAKTYQQAIKSLVLSYPALGPKQIIKMANKLYKPGEGGRPKKPVNLSGPIGKAISQSLNVFGSGAPFPGG